MVLRMVHRSTHVVQQRRTFEKLALDRTETMDPSRAIEENGRQSGDLLAMSRLGIQQRR